MQVVAPTSGLWLAYDHRRLLVASGRQGPTDTEVTTTLGVAVDRHFDRLDGKFNVRSAQLPELRRWRSTQSWGRRSTSQIHGDLGDATFCTNEQLQGGRHWQRE